MLIADLIRQHFDDAGKQMMRWNPTLYSRVASQSCMNNRELQLAVSTLQHHLHDYTGKR